MATLVIEVFPDGSAKCSIGSNSNVEKAQVADMLMSAIDKLLPNLVTYGDAPPKPFAEA